MYTRGYWHPGVIERMVAHLVAYPITLKMSLREEREASQVRHILDPNDVADLLAADSMHVHCLRVVCAYIYCVDEETLHGKMLDQRMFVGKGIRELIVRVVDQVDLEAFDLMCVVEFQPSLGYVNHLQIFMHIWLFFLPLSLVATSAWYEIFLPKFPASLCHAYSPN